MYTTNGDYINIYRYNKIIEYTSEGYKLYNTIDNNKDIQKKKLNQNYYKLAEEREIINNKMQEFQTIDQDINYSNSKINENYYSYLLLILLVIIFIIILIRHSVSKKLNS
jgi:organic radical activating enzyme